MKTFDICIVGSGAGGSPIAYELSRAGFSVAVFEKGAHYNKTDFSKDEIAVCRRDIYTPDLKDEQHTIVTYNSDGTEEYFSGADEQWSFWNGSMLGGSSNLMSGYFHRLKPDDFKQLSVYGAIDGANVADWPISYSDLEPYYTKVEQIVGVSGRVVEHAHQEPRSTKDFAYPPTEEQPMSGWIDEACKKLGFTSIPIPRAILPYNTELRDGCSYSNFCGSYGCATDAKGSARAALLQRIKYDLFADSFVYKIDADSKQVNQIHYYDKNHKSHSIKAKIFVISAQAHESVRLLMNSKNSDHPDGIGNTHKQLGKNLIFSAGGSGSGRILAKHLDHKKRKELFTRGLFVNRSIQDWYSYSKNNRVIKGGTIDFLYEHANPIVRAIRELRGNDTQVLYGRKLQKRLEFAFKESRVLKFEIFNDWLPTDRCYIGVDDHVRDKFGVNVGKLHLHAHSQDLEVGKYLASKAQMVLEELGAVEIESNISAAPPPNLIAGGCRFGDDPKTSVLDSSCRVHGLDNLYVCDASFMPTGGSVPYTWTIYANSFRVADIILQRLKNG